ncbi:glycoside hydrolase family 18 protein [Trifolium pratense]|uniref:Glycoside hydrolase family 18 protein n=1 Tax=Trifolium pratense TaxID=57577 RepID=A0A2K3P1D5_TRIPR|nr:glycoside hydrolase family 18 protein [Trifolium pratense]
MAYSKKHSFLLISTLLMILQLQFSSAKAAIKGGYWYSDSGLAVSDIDPSYFTHLFCAFADLDSNTNQVTISSTNAASFSTFTQTIQAKSSSVQTLLSIGGGGGSALAQKFANMASQASSRKSFIDSSIQLARDNNFNGLDLDWEYPSSDTDKTNFGLLITEWRAAVAQEASSSGNPALLLSAAVGGSDQITPLQYYPGQDIADNLDWVNVMTYDLFTSDSYPTVTQPPAPLKNPTGQFSAEEGITKWIGLGVPKSKLALGLPFYGFKWSLADPNDHGLFDTATQGLGAVKYKDIINAGAQVVYNSTYVTNYCFTGTDWYGYDDTQSISAKVDYAKQNGLFGYFSWHIEQDSNWALSQAGQYIGSPN